MIEFTVTVTMTTGSSWYVEDNTGSTELTASQTFTVQILNPCTATDLIFDSYSASVSVALGDSDTSTTVDITSASATYSTFCADTYYYDDGGCSFCTKALSGTTTTFTIAPSDDETNVGTYILQLHACYTNYLNYCSPPVTVTVTITSDCGSISGGTFTDPSAIAVFDTSADVTIARCTTTSSNTADCAMEWSIVSDPDTPSMISITQPTDLTAASGASRKVSFTSNDFDDVGTHTFTVSCWYTNYPTTNTVSNTLTLTVNDCSSSSSCSCTQLSISGDADWGNAEYIQPASASASNTQLFAAVTLVDVNSITLTSCTQVTVLERWDETQQEYYALDTTTHPKSSWLALDGSNNLVVLASSLADQPSPYVEYTVRVTYYISESEYGEDAYLYDVATFSVELTDDCSDFRWSDTTDSPSDGTYEIKATSASSTHSIAHPSNGLDATCSDSPTITLYYQEVGGITWTEIPSTIATTDGLDPLTSTTKDNSGSVDFDFDSGTWSWGDITTIR